MVLVRLRCAYSGEDLSDFFLVSPSTISRTFTTWMNLMYHKFRQDLPMWMSRRKVDKFMPAYFRKWYPCTRCMIDATEFFIGKPSSLERQSATWSNYKNHNTFKALVGISPDGTFTFVSDLNEGSISDVDLVEQCELLGLLEHGDSIMVDKGFDIQHLLTGIGVRLNIPPFRQGDWQFTPDDLRKTKKNCCSPHSCWKGHQAPEGVSSHWCREHSQQPLWFSWSHHSGCSISVQFSARACGIIFGHHLHCCFEQVSSMPYLPLWQLYFFGLRYTKFFNQLCWATYSFCIFFYFFRL